MFLGSIFIFIALVYFLLIFVFILGINKTEIFSNLDFSNRIQVSVIIAVRNEEFEVLNLINSLKKQNYPLNLFEVIFVNDHSTDKTQEIIENNLSENFKIIQLTENEFGKKYAIKSAIKIAKGEIIVTTDADCKMNENWLSTIVSFYETNNSDMILAPVLFKKRNNFLGIFQFYDFLALMSSTLGACAIKKPIMCNGANLIYKKEIFNEINNPLLENTSSGDDMFLMINLKKLNKKIDFLNSFDALVETKSEKSFFSFINQRIRWAGKNTKITDFDIISTGLIVYLFNVSIIILAILSIQKFELLIYFFQILFIKTFVEFILISSFASIYKQKIRLIIFFIIQPFHILYTVFVPVLSLIFPYKWKNRVLK
jgi:cellulose synthase/poly-beta-1,6-N-acetylglucosamine synthase-like glycosyltransferase